MPSRPRTTQNTPVKAADETQGESFSLDLGKTRGLYNSVGFRDKVLQWQQSADAAADSAHSDSAEEAVLGNGSPKATAKWTKDSRQRAGRKLLEDDNYLASKESKEGKLPMTRHSNYKMDRDIRRASAPKKRVVSDEHWKIVREDGRAQNKAGVEDHATANATDQKTHRVNAWVRKKPGFLKRDADNVAAVATGIPRTTDLGDPVENTQSTSFDHQSPKQQPTIKKTKNRDLGGTSNRLKSREPPRNAADLGDEDAGWHEEDAEQVTHKKKPHRTRTRSVSEETEQEGDQSRHNEDSVDGARLDFPKEPAAPPQIHSNSIEAWLTNTPDPFIDHKHHASGAEFRNLRHRARHSSKRDTAPVESSLVDGNANLRRHGATRSSSSPRTKPTDVQALDGSPTSSSISGVTSTRYLMHGDGQDHEIGYDLANEDRNLRNDKGSAGRFRDEPREPSTGAAIGSDGRDSAQSGSQLDEHSKLSNDPAGARREYAVKLATDDDLMSILSMPKPSRKPLSIRSKRSLKQSQPRTAAEIMRKLENDEKKYFSELRTLVDGVIPVLLSCVLSKSNSSIAHDLFGVSDEQKATSTIVSMGVALERLNSAHRRVPIQKPEALLIWAQSTHRIYADYIKVWRMGFQDVVVNLVPGEDAQEATKDSTANTDTISSSRTDHVANSEGERVDVAHLLKRPLVRIKHLAATLKEIHTLTPSEQSERWSLRFEDLVSQARTKQSEERARIEDEAAVAIDTTRARDPATLLALLGATIDPAKSVQARDFFDLGLCHSSGQRLDCHVELILRDSNDGLGSGDVLICEVDDTEKWLLFPPIARSNLSARKGSAPGEAIFLMRGSQTDGNEWREVFTLVSHDPMTGPEWIEMLGSYPMPPAVPSQTQAFPLNDASLVLAPKYGFGPLSPSDLDVPMGEQPTELSKQLGSMASFQPEPRSGAQRPSPTRQRAMSGYFTASSISPGHLNHTSMVKLDDPEKAPEGNSPVHRFTSKVPTQSPPTNTKARRESEAEIRERINKSTQPASPLSPQQHQQSIRRKPVPQQSPIGGLGGDSSTPQLMPVVQSRRRSSSPLKHEYQPSSGSATEDEGDGFGFNDAESITSNSSAGDLVPSIPPAHFFKKTNIPRAPETLYSADGAATLSPSNSASQAPYRHVPEQSEPGPKTIASIFSWSDKGLWENLHPDECSIVVSPGLIEAFEMTAAHSKSSDAQDDQGNPRPIGARPLVALELTPLVPLRRGTAIDISIRSPPTAASLLRAGNNVMFRSRNGQECEMLYNLINYARINNPTYIALQNARLTSGESTWEGYGGQRGSRKSGGGSVSSWWRFGSKRAGGYRAGSARRAQSTSGGTESSIATMASAFSALHRFSMNGNRLFNVAKSTITSRTGGLGIRDNLTRSSNTFSSSGSQKSGEPESPTSGSQTPIPADLLGEGSTPLGLVNQKIRLYMRETAGKWRDMGSARLTIMHPPRSASMGPMTPARLLNQERRIVVIGKTQGERLLDATLGETSFERVARTGIAVSVWERLIGPNGEEGTVGKTGGVVGTRVKVYMIQLKSEAETAYTFSLVGKLRY